MNTNKIPKSKKNTGRRGVKYVLSSLSLISVIGLWQHFANNDAITAAKATANDAQTSNNQIQFHPLPTLMTVQAYQQVNANPPTSSASSSQLREVTAPTAQPTSAPRIMLQHVTINNSGSGSLPSPVTRSGSSR